MKTVNSLLLETCILSLKMW